MDAGRWEEVKTLFGEALAQPAGQRAAFLDVACGADEALRAQVASLLDSYEEASGYFGDLAGEVLGSGWITEAHEAASPADPHQLIGQTVLHYEVLEKLGGGGMGVVYKARDTRLGRLVALKFLPPHLSADAAAKERFVHEAQSASALDHVNIGTIHEINETDVGQLFIAMAYYEGETLQARIARDGLSIEEVLDVAVQVARALAHAHAHGIVHRDVKPANVIITEPASTAARGVVKLIDFGLAKVADVTLTGRGMRLGTVAYMSPEQALGKPIDTRTDIWSLGVMLYEMIAGERPFQGEGEALLFHTIIHQAPPSLSSLRPDVPVALVQVVQRALEKNRDARFPTMEHLLAALRTMYDPDSGISGQAALYAEPERAPVSVVVLPFRDLGLNETASSLGRELTERVVADLSAVPNVHVIASLDLSGQNALRKDVRTIGSELNARYVLEGSVRTAGDRVRITARLIDSAQDTHLWTEKYTGTFGNLSGVQGKVASDIVRALGALVQRRG